MNFDYDIFEKFPDGSSLWRDSVRGFEKARVRLMELNQGLKNPFYAIDLATGEILVFNADRDGHEFPAPSITQIPRKSQCASRVGPHDSST
jgi:hypothetical protein